LSQFSEAVRNEAFAKYQKGFALRLTSSLSKDFLKGKKEIDLTHTIEDLVKSVHNYRERGRASGGPLFELSTKSIFIHGSKSHVQFDFYGTRSEPIELGDLIFICSVIFKGKKHFEKLTITQFKMQLKRKSVTSWRIDNEKQLFLLSRFPQFTVIRGIIPHKTYDLPNMSDCLGSYGLFFKPGDFTFVSATNLEAFLGGGKTVTLPRLASHSDRWQGCSSLCYPMLGDSHYCSNAYIFSDRFLKLNIGELVFNGLGTYNQQARILIQDLIGELRRRKIKTREPELSAFLSHLISFPCDDEDNVGNDGNEPGFDVNDGGIGIVHTKIDLGE